MLLTVALAGCFGEDGEDAEPADTEDPIEQQEPNETSETEEPLAPAITATWKNASWEGASIPADGYYCVPIITLIGECDNYHGFTVEANASAVVGELAWNTDDEMYFRVFNASGSTVAQETGASPLRLVVEKDLPAEDSAEWELEAWIDATTPTEVEATFVASVVETGDLPADFAKLKDA